MPLREAWGCGREPQFAGMLVAWLMVEVEVQLETVWVTAEDVVTVVASWRVSVSYENYKVGLVDGAYWGWYRLNNRRGRGSRR